MNAVHASIHPHPMQQDNDKTPVLSERTSAANSGFLSATAQHKSQEGLLSPFPTGASHSSNMATHQPPTQTYAWPVGAAYAMPPHTASTEGSHQSTHMVQNGAAVSATQFTQQPATASGAKTETDVTPSASHKVPQPAPAYYQSQVAANGQPVAHPSYYNAYPPYYPGQPYSGMTVPPPPGFPYSAHPSFYSVEQQPPPGVVFARSADPRITRPKVKLTYEDKRRIVEIARSNTSLRQEDIAQQYGVDRSTISKILISAHRWTGPPQPPVVPLPKPVKSSGGRFPAIEQRMHEWMDAQHAAGYEIKDQVARDKAKDIARSMGFTDDRFKASAKWLDKFKERRKQLGLRASVTATFESDRPFLPSAADGVPVIYSDQRAAPLPFTYSFYSGSSSPAVSAISRSQSSTTLSEHDMVSTSEVSRQLSPSHGPQRAMTLSRQNSFQGSPPRRMPLHRSNSSISCTSLKRGNRPTSLAASAFGLTPVDYSQQPMLVSPGTTSTGTTSTSSSSHSIGHLPPLTPQGVPMYHHVVEGGYQPPEQYAYYQPNPYSQPVSAAPSDTGKPAGSFA